MRHPLTRFIGAGICHEDNYSIADILAAARAKERREAEAERQ